MLTRTLFPILTLALAGSLVLACGSPDRIFDDGGSGGTGTGGTGGAPMDGSAGSGGNSDASTTDQESEPTVGDGAMVDGSPTDASTDARGDAASDGRGDALSDGGRADLVATDIAGDLAVNDTALGDTVGDTAVNDISVSDAGSDAPVDGSGTPDIGSDIIDCSGTPVPRISPTGAVGVCPGKTVTLTSTSAVSYLWSNSATTQSVAVPAGSYTVTTTDARGCMATSTPTVVSTYPTPTTPTITAGGPTRFCSGGSVTLSSSPGSSYSWSNGATTQTIVVTASGSYTVTTTDANGCQATSAPTTVTVVMPPTGTRTFTYTAGVDNFVVPECVTSVLVEAYGAQGGGSNGAGLGGYGGLMYARIPVQPAATLQIRVGGAGSLCTSNNTGGYNGGGIANCNGYNGGAMWFYSGSGGGATDVRVSPYTLDDRVLVAGGGGGSGFNCNSPDDNGAVGGGNVGGQYPSACPSAAWAGAGGTQTAGGLGGTDSGSYGSSGNGAYGVGGSGYATGGTITSLEGGGGGGGYFGGGGGNWIGGGGGSDYLRPMGSTLVVQTPGSRAGHGVLNLSY